MPIKKVTWHHYDINLYSRATKNVSRHYISKLIYFPFIHDDVIKWKHFPRNWPFVREIHRSPVNFPHKGQWRGALMFSLIYAWINDWVNNREAGDLRRQDGHYDVIVMSPLFHSVPNHISSPYFHSWSYLISHSISVEPNTCTLHIQDPKHQYKICRLIYICICEHSNILCKVPTFNLETWNKMMMVMMMMMMMMLMLLLRLLLLLLLLLLLMMMMMRWWWW